MRAQFNYIVFYVRILFVLGWSALVIATMVILPGEMSRKHDLLGVIGGMVGFAFLFGMFSFKFWRAVWTERFGMIISPGQVIIKDHLLFRSFVLRSDEIKGFSISDYPIRIKGVKSILFYLSNGRKIEFPQFLFFNFRKLAGALKENGMPFLGEERYMWKWIDSRTYKYDNRQE